MKTITFLILATLILSQACTTLRNQGDPELDERIIVINKFVVKNRQDATLNGNVIDCEGETFKYAQIKLTKLDKEFGTFSDQEGEFKFASIPSGLYLLRVESSGFNTLQTKIFLKEGQTVTLEIKMKAIEIRTEKPIIYLYPSSKQKVTINLDYDGELEFTYPKYPKTGWEVTAEPNGTLTDLKGKEYYALFWEGKPNKEIIPQTGFIIAGNQTAEFLEEKLAYLGLNRKEANEFIVYWLPKMEKNAFNLIHFSSSEYVDMAKLEIEPKPETIIRIMMITKPLEGKIDFPIQDLSPLKKERKGFTVVEWGGSISSKNFVN
jgi:hypothetical protein